MECPTSRAALQCYDLRCAALHGKTTGSEGLCRERGEAGKTSSGIVVAVGCGHVGDDRRAPDHRCYLAVGIVYHAIGAAKPAVRPLAPAVPCDLAGPVNFPEAR